MGGSVVTRRPRFANVFGVGVAAVLLGACLPVTPPGGGGGGAPIGPHQHYVGVVNGSTTKAVIDVVCPGPAGGNRTGPPAANQTVAVHQVASGGGDTGSVAHELWAQFPKDLLHLVAFHTYDTPGTIPASLRLPCSGTGIIDFTTCFGTLPCATDAVDDLVPVTFVNIAV